MKKTIIFDMYGVIIKESKGNFVPYTFDHFNESEYERIKKAIFVDKLFTKAGNGEMSSDQFLTELGYQDPVFHMHDYIENHLTMDEDFYIFAKKWKEEFQFALLSNDVSEWSKYIIQYYQLESYLSVRVVSGDVKCRKPNEKIYQIMLNNLKQEASQCFFIDNSVENLRTAEKLGMNTILFNRDNEEYEGTTIDSFHELSEFICEVVYDN